jgi:hypothetical protein
MLGQQNHAAGGANGSIMVVVFVCLRLASKKPSEREFFVPAGTDLGVKLLNITKNNEIVNKTSKTGKMTGVVKAMKAFGSKYSNSQKSSFRKMLNKPNND